MKIVAAKKILKANDQLAEENRSRFNAAGVFGLNVVGSPGCGKTTLLEGLFQHLKGRLALAVIEGDIAGSVDAERIDALGVPVVQINTEGACHLDAMMIAAACARLRFAEDRSARYRERRQSRLHRRVRLGRASPRGPSQRDRGTR